MSRVPLGKVLLRNVIRHTDAHNKIQEESEMWKIREMEKQSEDVYWGKQKRVFPNSSSSRMRSDGFDEESQQANWKARNLAPVSVTMEDDLRHARYWNKKLYECEANMPDRWGHSGYKELYPEEFDTDSDQQEQEEQNSVNGKRKSHPGKQASLELSKRKKAKKSHKKKRKKKSHKKRKKKKREQLSTTAESSQESECSEGVAGRRKRKRHKKAKKTAARTPVSSSGRDSNSSKASTGVSSSSEDSDPEEKQERQPKKKRRKHRVPASERCSERVQEKRSKRKNWKVAADENSEDSSDED
ncbi:hypothetical protein EYD10_16349 [Varanus komodoensis]|uniref:NKAP domain containing 1 n=1 Tax=Varanus komodoensis TaxID=61221 RepID=A0A8D2LNL3_VARKO|nr:uncharacterized protein NKAPD1 [Varanus komodoensis]XP_044312327.1 uncharacterized protein NKAPD1 [Varanus komodoensis]KAF7236922.1 hypothetical protein EYD10_16349 [Varanus komodoensis]